jgi:hypothetical protein
VVLAMISSGRQCRFFASLDNFARWLAMKPAPKTWFLAGERPESSDSAGRVN